MSIIKHVVAISAECFAKFSRIYAIMLICSHALVAIAADESIRVVDKLPNQSLTDEVRNYFEIADEISIRYIPNQNMGTPFVRREYLDNYWKYKFSYRCPTTCRENASEVQSLLSRGLRMESECPEPFYALLKLISNGTEVVKIYIHQSGRCFILHDRSYYIENSFDSFFQPGKLFPDFVK